MDTDNIIPNEDNVATITRYADGQTYSLADSQLKSLVVGELSGSGAFSDSGDGNTLNILTNKGGRNRGP